VFDYEARYRELRSRGLPGWAGEQYERGQIRLKTTLDRLLAAGDLPPPPARILELGCGNGASSALLAPKGFEVHGVDVSATAIAWAEERFAAAGLSGAFRQGDVSAMPFHADGAFDAVLDSACLHCLIGPARQRCLAEVRRILRPNGVFIVSSMVGPPRSAEALAGFDATAGHLLKDGTPYRTLKPLEALVAELVAAGFDVRPHDVAANPWWDHATLICRLPQSIGDLDNGATYG